MYRRMSTVLVGETRGSRRGKSEDEDGTDTYFRASNAGHAVVGPGRVGQQVEP